VDRKAVEVDRLETRAERVDYVTELMASGRWLTERSQRRVLAAAWNVTEHAVRSYSAEAHRRLMVDSDERDEMRQAIAMRMLAIADRAGTTFSNVTGMADLRSEMDALDKYAAYSGLDIASVADKKREPVKVEIVYAGEAPKPPTAE
jgi:hypothetical protein